MEKGGATYTQMDLYTGKYGNISFNNKNIF